eukprot:766668_1
MISNTDKHHRSTNETTSNIWHFLIIFRRCIPLRCPPPIRHVLSPHLAFKMIFIGPQTQLNRSSASKSIENTVRMDVYQRQRNEVYQRNDATKFGVPCVRTCSHIRISSLDVDNRVQGWINELYEIYVFF